MALGLYGDTKPFAGLYWTFPVPWAGFTSLPKGVDEAAARSRTVRYQRDLVRAHVAAEGGILVRELVFLEVSPDHATDAYEEVMADLLALCRSREVCACYVEFGQQMGWRKHDRLRHALERRDLRTDPVAPRKLRLDGEWFDPKVHFRTWREADAAFRQGRALAAHEALLLAADAVPPGRGRHGLIADSLNGRGITTHSGKAWTADNVRMALRAGAVSG